MPEILSIPFKRTLTIDFEKELSTLIDNCSIQTSSFFKEDIENLVNIRANVLDIDVSEEDLIILKQYYCCLEQLAKKFPSDKIQFTWFQTLTQKSCKASEYSLRFEELNIIYNIGSMYSLLASKYNDSTSEGTKKACLYLQKSAGYFEYLRAHIHDTEELVIDLNSIEAIIMILLASAQELTWFKSIQDKYQDSLISKLAKQTSIYYFNALTYSKKSELIRGDWIGFIQNKMNYFLAVAYYRYACSIIPKKIIGVAIRSLVMARSYLNLCSSNFDSTISLNKNPFNDKIDSLLKDSERDNDFIYLQPIPDTVEELKSASMVSIKNVTDSDLQCDNIKALFKDLIPLELMNLVTAYNERQDTYITELLIKPIEALNTIIRDKLVSSLKTSTTDNLNNGDNIRMVPIRNDELDAINQQLDDFSKINKDISNILRQTEEILILESENNDNLTKKYGTLNWTLEDSKIANSEYHDTLDKLNNYLLQGSMVDNETKKVFSLIDKEILLNPNDNIPKPDNAKLHSTPIVKKINNIINERENLIKSIKNKSSSSRILPKIVSVYKQTSNQLNDPTNDTTIFENEFQDHLRQFDTYKTQIEEIKSQNNELEQEIDSNINDLNQTHHQPNQITRISAKELFLKDWNESSKLFDQVRQNITEGIIFYNDLYTKSNSLHDQVVDFNTTRTIKSTTLLNSIKKMDIIPENVLSEKP